MNAETKPSPYVHGKRVWEFTEEEAAANARRWRWAFFIALMVMVCCIAAVVWFAGQPRLIPYVVEVNGKGQIAGVYSPDRMTDPTTEQNVLRYSLGQFISDMRSVTPDTTLQRRMITRVYAFLTGSEPAHQQVGQWYRKNKPFERSQTEMVAVEIKQILPLTAQTWRVEWTERSFARNGELQGSENMTASLGILQGGEVSEENLLLNPTGLYITQVNWQRELSQIK